MSLALVVPGLLAGLAVMFRQSIIPDGDPFWHIAVGNWVLEHGTVPRSDPFSYTASGSWSALEWVSQVAMAVAYQHSGMQGVQALFGVSVGVLGIVLASYLLKTIAPVPAMAIQYFALANVVEAAQARPQFLVLPIIAFWMAALLEARHKRRAPHWGLLPVMVLWANLHGSFILGPVLFSFFAVEALLEEPKKRVALQWGAMLAGSCVAALVTPWGMDAPFAAYELTSMAANVYIGEWGSSTFDQLKTFEVCILAGLFVCLLFGVRIPIVRLVLLLALLHQTLHHQRYTVVFVLLGAMLLAEPLANTLRRFPEDKIATNWLAMAASATVFIVFSMVRLATPEPIKDTALTPVTALASVPSEISRQPVFNQFELGGFLILSAIRPFIDGRADVYGSDFVSNYGESINDRNRLQTTLHRYGVVWTITAVGHPLDRTLGTLAGWTLTYRDRYTAIRVRSDQSIDVISSPDNVQHR